jgi:hypothetical protein
MPTAYNNQATLDRPYGPGEFARFAETAGQGVLEPSQYMEEAPEAANYSSHPALQVEVERQAASSLATPADAYRGSEFQVPQSPEVTAHEARIHSMAVEATLAGGVENMLSHAEASAEAPAYFDNSAQERAQDATAPRPEAQYESNGALLEAYRSGCAIMPVRRLYLQGSEANQ